MAEQAGHMEAEVYWPGLKSVPELDDIQFRQWVDLLEERTGSVLPAERRSFLATSVAQRMREAGFDDYQAYYDFICSGKHGFVEWMVLVDRLTVHETRFFRQPESLELIRSRFLPQQAEQADSPHKVQIWSLGCATGEEAYTLAIMLDDHFRQLQVPCYFSITATDISLASLAAGRRAQYHPFRVKDVPAALKERYLVCLENGYYEVDKALRSRVCFAQLNVMNLEQAPYAAMDVIFFQNVLIYFDLPRRQQILEQLVQRLAPGGLLLLGPGEMPGWRHPQLERVEYAGTLAYRRRDEETAV
jgi:chemotaxis protein methyltransferase CheR/type IV pilus assembly protein PilK